MNRLPQWGVRLRKVDRGIYYLKIKFFGRLVSFLFAIESPNRFNDG